MGEFALVDRSEVLLGFFFLSQNFLLGRVIVLGKIRHVRGYNTPHSAHHEDIQAKNKKIKSRFTASRHMCHDPLPTVGPT